MPSDDQLIDAFVQVFRGRADIYGNAKGFMVKERLTRAVFEKHLRSTNQADHVGVYCMLGDKASWGCIDIDGKDFAMTCGECAHLDPEGACGKCHDGFVWDWAAMLGLARNLQAVLKAAPGGGIESHIERTKNGYHVWVFPQEPLVPARTMRRALMAACKAIGYDPKEVNPKAEKPRSGTKGYGNFVRLPYGGWIPTVDGAPVGPRWFLHPESDDEECYDLGAALQRIEALRTPTAHLDAVAALWTPPPVAHHEVDMDAGLEVENLLPLLDGKSWTIWKDGPLPGSDRSSTLAHLAHLLRERGLPATQAFAVVKSADARWGKFQDRPEEVARLVEIAYS